MNQNVNKKPIIILFGLMVCLLLFVYKGFIKSGEEYYKEYVDYDQKYVNKTVENDMNHSSLKKTKGANSQKEGAARAKIPPEISMLDNIILDSKSLIERVNFQNENILQNLNIIYNLTNNFNKTNNLSDSINELYKRINSSIEEIMLIKRDNKNIDKNLDDLSSNVESLRKYDIIEKKEPSKKE